MNDISKLRLRLGEYFSHLAVEAVDEVDHFINSSLDNFAVARTFAGWEGMQAVAKLKKMASMSRTELRAAAEQVMAANALQM